MKITNLLSIICFSMLLFSCQKESVNIDVKSLDVRFGDESYRIDYKVENGSIELVSELPQTLKDLRDNKDLQLTRKGNELLLIEKVGEKTADVPLHRPVAANMRAVTEDYGVSQAFLNQFGLEKVSQYGFLTNSFEKDKAYYPNEYDFYIWYKPNIKTKKYFLNGEEFDYNVDLAFGFSNGNQVELIQADSTENNFFGNFLKTQEGLHHYGFEVKDAAAKAELFKTAGYDLTVEAEFESKGGLMSKIYFFDTRATTGAYTEIIESKLLGFNVSQNEALFIFGLFLGDTSLIHP